MRNTVALLFKCLTTRAVHIEVLSSINTDSLLLVLRRLISLSGKPAELFSDQGTNFKGGDRELQEAFKTLHLSLQALLAEQTKMVSMIKQTLQLLNISMLALSLWAC